MSPTARLLPLLLAACAAAPAWQTDLPQALAAARAEGRDLVVYFALPGRAASDRMQASLTAPGVRDALAQNGFAAALADAAARTRLYAQWIGYGEGFGVAVVDGEGRVYAARPGPQDPLELAAFLRHCAAVRGDLVPLRRRLAQPTVAPTDRHALGCLLLDLGATREAESLLLDAAMAGVADARHRLARLYALVGDLAAARRWLAGAPSTPAARATEGYLLFKERRPAEAVTVLEAALATGGLGRERQRTQLWLGKALHEARADERAVSLLAALAAEGTGSVVEAAAQHVLAHIRDPSAAHAP